MKCDKCGKESFIEINMLSENSYKKLNLCFDCYKKILDQQEEWFGFQELPEMGELNISQLLKQMVRNIFSDKQEAVTFVGEEKECPMCGTTSSELFEYGNVGCENCYDIFQENIANYFEETKNYPFHYGDCPEEFCKYNSLREQIQKSDSEIEKFVLTEEYEKAAASKKIKEQCELELKEWEDCFDE